MTPTRRNPLRLSILIALLPAATMAQDAVSPHDQEREKTLDQLVVTASPLLPGSEDVVQPVTVIAGKELDARKAGTIGETVAKEVGVQSSFFGGGVGRPIIRGQDGARVQVLEGGVSALDVSTVSVDHAVSIEPFLADQIEILKGPATLLYGSGAVGGAVNVVDGRVPAGLPDSPLTGRAEIRGNTGADERTGMLRLDGGSGAFAWHVDAFDRSSDDTDIPGYAESEHAHESHEGEGDDHHDDEDRGAHGVLPNSAIDTRGGALGASWIGARGFLGAAVSRYETLYGIPGHAHEHAHEEGGAEPEEEEAVRIDLAQTRYDVKGALTAPFDGVDSIRVQLAHNQYRHVELEGDEIGTRFDNQGSEARIELVHAVWKGWRGAAGLQFGQRDFEALGAEAFVPPSRTDDLGVFVLEERDFDRFKLELGARHDGIDIDPDGFASRSFHATSFSAGGIWRATEALHVSLGFDRAERAPTAEELFSNGAHIATQSFEVGNPALEAETANQLELGVHLHVGPLSAKLSTFQNRYDEFITLLDTGEESDELPLRRWSQADATFRGFEGEAELRLIDNASGTWDLRLFGDKVRASLDAGGALPRIVPARVGTGLTWEREGWRASAGAIRHADQEKIAAFEESTDGYTLVDAHLAYHWDTARIGWEVFADGSNLTDREARVHTSFLKDLAPLPGRTIAFGLRAFF
jgi:iron complex outermembrane receptor protein